LKGGGGRSGPFNLIIKRSLDGGRKRGTKGPEEDETRKKKVFIKGRGGASSERRNFFREPKKHESCPT